MPRRSTLARWGWASLVLCAFAALCFGPPIYLLAVSLSGEGGATGELFSGRDLPLLGRTLGMAAVAAIVAGVAGGCYGGCTVGARRRIRPVLALLGPLPFLVPPYLMATAWSRLLGGPDAPFEIFGWGGSGVVLGLCFYPLVGLPVAAGLNGIGGGPIDAGRMYLGRLARLRMRIGMLRSHLLGGMALVFALAASNLAVPLIMRTNVYSLEVFTQFSAYYSFSGAVIAAVPLVAMAVILLVGRQIVLARAPVVMSGPRWRPATPSGSGSWLQTAVAMAIFAVALALPFGVLVDDIRDIAELDQALRAAGEEVFVSLEVGALAAVLMVALGSACGRLLARARPWVQLVVGSLALVPLVMPGAIVGLGFVSMANDELLPQWVTGSIWILALVAAARYISFAILLAWAAELRVTPRFMEAARPSGLSAVRRWWSIRLPLAAPELCAALAFCFCFALGELAGSVLLTPPGTTTLSVRLASLLHFGEDGIVSALCLVLAALALLVLGLFSFLANRVLELDVDPR